MKSWKTKIMVKTFRFLPRSNTRTSVHVIANFPNENQSGFNAYTTIIRQGARISTWYFCSNSWKSGKKFLVGNVFIMIIKRSSVRNMFSDNLDVFQTAVLKARTQPSKEMIHAIEVMNIFVYMKNKKLMVVGIPLGPELIFFNVCLAWTFISLYLQHCTCFGWCKNSARTQPDFTL